MTIENIALSRENCKIFGRRYENISKNSHDCDWYMFRAHSIYDDILWCDHNIGFEPIQFDEISVEERQ